MPNGNHDSERELPVLNKFFGQFSDELESFAERHNLLIEKYRHQFHSWRFSFKPPKGGIGALELFRETDMLAAIYSYWWIDDYDEFARYSKKGKTQLFEAYAENIEQMLEEKFTEIMRWKKGELKKISGYEEVWNRYDKEKFYAFNKKYPVPII